MRQTDVLGWLVILEADDTGRRRRKKVLVAGPRRIPRTSLLPGSGNARAHASGLTIGGGGNAGSGVTGLRFFSAGGVWCVVLTADGEALGIGNGDLHLRRYARFGSGWALQAAFWAIEPKPDGRALRGPKGR